VSSDTPSAEKSGTGGDQLGGKKKGNTGIFNSVVSGTIIWCVGRQLEGGVVT